eukprot:g47962.t1
MDMSEILREKKDILAGDFSWDGQCVKIDMVEVLDVLTGIQVPKSLGPDKMYPRLQWMAMEEITGALVTGEVPDDWTISNVIPLFKKGSRDRP